METDNLIKEVVFKSSLRREVVYRDPETKRVVQRVVHSRKDTVSKPSVVKTIYAFDNGVVLLQPDSLFVAKHPRWKKIQGIFVSYVHKTFPDGRQTKYIEAVELDAQRKPVGIASLYVGKTRDILGHRQFPFRIRAASARSHAAKVERVSQKKKKGESRGGKKRKPASQ